MTKAKKSAFYRVYLIAVVTFLALLVIFIGVMLSYLSAYEKSTPDYMADEVFEKYFKGSDFSSVPDGVAIETPLASTESEFERYIASKMTSDAEYHSVSGTSDDPSEKKYLVRSNDTKIAYFTLKKNTEKGKWGRYGYALASISPVISSSNSFTVKVPAGYTIYLGDTAVPDSYIKEKGITGTDKDHIAEGLTPKTFDLYEIKGLINDAKPKCVSASGESAELEILEGGDYEAKFVCDKTLSSEYSDYVVKVAEEYAKYMQNDASFAKIAAYMKSGTELYKNVRNNASYFAIAHDSYLFEDVVVSDFYAYDDATFSCRVKFTHTLKRTGSKDYNDYFDKTMYFVKVDGKYLLYDMENNADAN